MSTAALVARAIPIMAGPFERTDFQHLVPGDKKLSAQWMASLFERGEPTVYRSGELGFIGMPIGGITTGQLYLGGDGRLWHWDIFNQTQFTRGERYANPVFGAWFSPVEHTFSLKILDSEPNRNRLLTSDGFADVSFRGEYPIGYVAYRDPACPLTVSLEAFSPFIPLDVEDSSLPATILRFTLSNAGATTVAGELAGLLENAVARSTEPGCPVARANSVERHENLLLLNCSATVSLSKSVPDAGTMGLALLTAIQTDTGIANLEGRPVERPAGSLTRKFSLAPGESQVATYAVVWHFPNLSMDGVIPGASRYNLQFKGPIGRYYATRFDSAAAVARYLARHLDRLYAQTKLWHDTWYDSSLPHWLLERTVLNVSTLATATAFRFADGRFYASEGVGCCAGTCTHVWQYEQAMGRLFPELDVLLRERADFNPGVSFKADGAIDQRGEINAGPAIDGQAGTILRALRDHQTSADDGFLRRNWASIKKATQWLIAQDGNADGILEGAQPNTLDTAWYGPVAWLSSLYLAALRAAEEMARDVGDTEFAARCRQIFSVGQKNFVDRLFDGGYFVNRPDPAHPESINSGTGCEIDQVLGQSWAFQVGLGRVLPEKETRSALASLWRYNFTPDVGPYRSANKPGRWYAMPGEAGLLMCTFPRTDWDFEKSRGTGQNAFVIGYFNECMSGFEHQVAGHMIGEGMVMEGLAIERAIHDRYHASRRNPWNEVECGDHYARSMASYGVFIAACGFEYHGPKGYLGFEPRIKPENFKAAFTAAQGWGQFVQTVDDGVQASTIDLKWGKLRLRTLGLAPIVTEHPTRAVVTFNGAHIPARLALEEGRARISLSRDLHLRAGNQVTVNLS